MSQHVCPLLLTLPGLGAVFMAAYAWERRRVPTAGALAAVMASVAIWSLASAAEMSSNSLTVALQWVKVEYLGIATVPVTWLIFALHYAGRSAWLTSRRLALLFVVPLVTILLMATNEWHHLYYHAARLTNLGGAVTVVPEPGPAYWLHATYSYLVIAAGLAAIIRTVRSAGPRHRGSSMFVLGAVLAPWLTNICYILHLTPVPGVDFTPFAFTLTGLALTWALFRLRLLDLAPIARDAVFEAISDGVAVVDEQGHIADLNAAAERILGCKATAACGVPVEQILPCWPQVRAYCDDTGVHRLKQRLGVSDDERIFEMRLFALRSRRAGPSSVLLFISDITEQERAQEALRATEVSYHELFNAVGEAIYVQDREGHFLDTNYGAELMYGYPRDFFIGKTPAALAAPGKNDLAAVSRMIEQAFTSEPQELEFWGQRANGEVFPTDVHLYKGTYLGEEVIIALVVDITARKQMERTQRLAAAGQLAAGVAHEFNNLLAAMLLQAEMADPDNPLEARELKEVVLRSARRGGATCADLMAFARPAEPRRQPVLIEDTVERALAVSRRKIENAQVEVIRETLAAGARVHGDPGQLEQVILNFIINAVDAMNSPQVPLARRKLTIAIEHVPGPPAEVALRVTDTGTGIAPEHLARVFEPFFTTKSAVADGAPRGTGLGLSVSHGIITAHGGRMEVSSEPHQGTTFTVHLPLLDEDAEVAPDAETPAEAQAPAARPSRILVVEDEPDIRSAVVAALTQLGHTVTTATTTEEALAALDSGSFEAAVTDLTIPGAGGAAVLQHARALAQPVPTIVITGQLDPQLSRQMADRGASAVLKKPFSLATLLATLTGLLPREEQ